MAPDKITIGPGSTITALDSLATLRDILAHETLALDPNKITKTVRYVEKQDIGEAAAKSPKIGSKKALSI